MSNNLIEIMEASAAITVAHAKRGSFGILSVGVGRIMDNESIIAAAAGGGKTNFVSAFLRCAWQRDVIFVDANAEFSALSSCWILPKERWAPLEPRTSTRCGLSHYKGRVLEVLAGC